MNKFLKAPIYLFLPLVLLAPRAVLAQATASGTVLGTIADPSQAVVTGAHVTIISVATGTARTTLTNNEGSYRFDLLPAGAYKLAVEGTGFATSTQAIQLLVGQTATANVTLQPGTATQTIEVTGINPLVDL